MTVTQALFSSVVSQVSTAVDQLGWQPCLCGLCEQQRWWKWYEPLHDKTNKMTCAPSEDSDQLGICSVWSEFSLSARRNPGSLATHWVHSKDSDQIVQMSRLIWVFAGRTGHFVGFVMQRLIPQLLLEIEIDWKHLKPEKLRHQKKLL